jgi:hypothetical protein
MAYETRDNSGRLFKNEEKKERGPDYSGDCLVNGVPMYMDAWLKTAESGRKWMSFSFKAKQQQRQAAPQKPAEKLRRIADDDSDVPF